MEYLGKVAKNFAGIFQVFSRYCAFVFPFPGICFFFSRYCALFFLSAQYLENTWKRAKSAEYLGKSRQYFAGIFQFFSFSRYWLFLSGISHFLPFLTAEYLERKGQYLEKVNTWKKAKKSSKFYRYWMTHLKMNDFDDWLVR